MRVPASFASLAACAAVLFAATLLPQPGLAKDVKPAEPPRCTCPAPDKPIIATKPKFAEAKALLDENDEIAALEAIRVALTEVGDGASYVWHRRHGRLSGVVHPTSSFKDPAGRVCRNIVLILTVGTATGRAEGVACRLADGRWQLDG